MAKPSNGRPALPVELIVVYDNELHDRADAAELIPAWGFSVLLKRGDEHVLFDCGWRGMLLLDNLKALGEEPALLGRIVISHDHWDHMGGLPDLLSVARRARVYCGASLSPTYRREIATLAPVCEVEGPGEIGDWLMTAGELPGLVQELSLVVRGSSGLTLITGCAHPGLHVILERVTSLYGKIHAVIGGFHGFKDLPALPDLSLVVPCHCTKHKKLLCDRFGTKVRPGGVGLRMVL
jgi:7,8-dihydropterin-6-yl-methyl-4-(beta-D-ribofuranosyl)aminobenzene 5'-phosphate synthase